MSTLIDLIGQKFGRLEILKRTENDKWGNPRWLCCCDCGKEIIIIGHNLKSGGTKSCGCLQKETITQINMKHNHSRRGRRNRAYRSWDSMKQRCNNPNRKDYKDYGGRGITVCERWLNENGFVHFLEDMGERLNKRYTLERINNNRGYYKENCKWATKEEQASNTRKNHLETYNGKTQHLAAWGREFNICPKVLLGRIRNNWPMEKALTEPVR